jgi:hypothetical protein
VLYSVSNHFGLLDAFDTLSMCHLIDLLATAADYLTATVWRIPTARNWPHGCSIVP